MTHSYRKTPIKGNTKSEIRQNGSKEFLIKRLEQK